MQELGLSWDEVTQMPARAALALRVVISSKASAEQTQERWSQRESRTKGPA